MTIDKNLIYGGCYRHHDRVRAGYNPYCQDCVSAAIAAIIELIIQQEQRIELIEAKTKTRCEDCGRPYGDINGFPDLVVDHDVWELLMPGREGGGLLCPSCMCERAAHLGLQVNARFTSGPFCEQEPIGYKIRLRNGVEYGPFESNELICIYHGQEVNNEASPQM